LQAAVKAWKESEAVFFSRSSDSLATFDHDSFSWKTSQLSLLEDLNEFSWSSLRSGMIVAGRLYQPENLAPRTCGSGGSYLLPTPTASAAGTNGKTWCEETQAWINGRPTLETMARKNLWPTPIASDASKGIRTPDGAAAEIVRKRLNGVDLPTAVGGGSLSPMWVEWLMGYRLEWTALEDWAIQWFRSKREKRLKN
jgi:hypothetical protein